MESNKSSSLINEPYFFLILEYLSQHANFVDKNIVISDVTTEIPSEEKRGIEAVYLFVQSQVEDTIDKMVNFKLLDSEYRLITDHQSESHFIKLSNLGKEFLADKSDNSGTSTSPKITSVDVSGGFKKEAELTLNIDRTEEAVEEPVLRSVHDVLVSNQGFVQAVNNLRTVTRKAKADTIASNYLSINESELQNEAVE